MKIHLNEQILKDLYLNKHLTLAQIASITGVSRQAIHYYVKKHGIDAKQAENCTIKCDFCHKEFTILRCRFNKTRNHYCSHKCYTSTTKNETYLRSRNGMRIARKTVSETVGRPLTDEEVVHHIDGNNDNNDISNLLLFKNQAEHLKYHHKQRLEKLQYPYAE